MNAIRMSAVSGIPRHHSVMRLVELMIVASLLMVCIGLMRARAPELARSLGVVLAVIFAAEPADCADQF